MSPNTDTKIAQRFNVGSSFWTSADSSVSF